MLASDAESPDPDLPKSHSSPLATSATAAISEGLPAISKALGMPEPHSVSAVCRALHCVDSPAGAVAPEFNAGDVRDAWHGDGDYTS
jgi:hypothetical protein